MYKRIHRAHLVLLAAAIGLGLAACGNDKAPVETHRTVLVVQPGNLTGGGVSAFAGEIHARQESPLAFRVGGNLQRRLVDAGDAVRRGQVLAELDPGDQTLQANAAKAQLAAAEADLARTRGDLARYKKLLDQQLVSRSSYDAQLAAYKAAEGQANAARAQAALTGNQTDYTRLRAPRDGVIASRQAEAGQVVSAGQPIFTLAADSGREVAINLPESHIRDFQTGQPAMIELWSAPGQQLQGRIREIAAAADPQTRTYAARVALDDAAAADVALGQSARVIIIDANAAGSLRVPLAAVQRGDNGGGSLWVVDDAGKVRQRAVKLGAYGEDTVPVLSGLHANEWVVAGGGHLLREGEQVNPVDRRNRPVGAAAAATAPAAKQAR